jgi:hypothetical protein
MGHHIPNAFGLGGMLLAFVNCRHGGRPTGVDVASLESGCRQARQSAHNYRCAGCAMSSVTVHVIPADRNTSAGTWSMWIRTGTRCASRTQKAVFLLKQHSIYT